MSCSSGGRVGGITGTFSLTSYSEWHRRDPPFDPQSIYPDYLSGNSTGGTIKLEIPIELPEPTLVLQLNEAESTTKDTAHVTVERKRSISKDSGESDNIMLSTLPPLLLEIILPPSYPLYLPPQIVSLHATHGWLARKVFPLRQHLLDMWHTGDGVLYGWIEWIRSGEFLDTLHLLKSAGGRNIVMYALQILSCFSQKDSQLTGYRTLHYIS